MTKTASTTGTCSAVVIVTGTGPVTSLTVRAVLDLVYENRPDIIIDLNGHRYLCEAAFPQPLPYAALIKDAGIIKGRAPEASGPRDFFFTAEPEQLAAEGFPRECVYQLPDVDEGDAAAVAEFILTTIGRNQNVSRSS